MTILTFILNEACLWQLEEKHILSVCIPLDFVLILCSI